MRLTAWGLALWLYAVSTGCAGMTTDLSAPGFLRIGAPDHAAAAKEAFEKGQYDQTIAYAETATKSDPNYLPGWYWLGLGYQAKGRYEPAIQALEKVLGLNQGSPLAVNSHLRLANLYFQVHDYDKAVANAGVFTRLEPKSAEGWYWLGLNYHYNGQFDEAIHAFNKVFPLGQPGWWNEWSYFWQGWTYARIDDWTAALAAFQKAVEVNPALEVHLRHARGWYHIQETGKHAEALKAFDAALEIRPPDDKGLLRLLLRGKAYAYLGLGDDDSALHFLNKAKAVEGYVEHWDDIFIYAAMGDKAKAYGPGLGQSGSIGAEVRDYNRDGLSGARVIVVQPGSPAQQGGLLRGDVILAIGDARIAGANDLYGKIGALSPGTAAKIKILRHGEMQKELTLSVSLWSAVTEGHSLIARIVAKRRAGGDDAVVKLQPSQAPAPTQEDVESPPVSTTPANPEAYAVVIGIERYRQAGLPPAEYAVRDAQSIYAYLTRAMGFDPKNVVLLQNDQAAKSDLDKYLGRWLKNRVTKQSRVFIYYSGHGAPNPASGKAYLVPYDGDPNYTEDTAYSVETLYAGLAQLPTHDVTVVLDSCFSGAGGRSVLAKGARPMVVTAEDPLTASGKTVVLAAAGGSQISTSYPDGQHGLLTYFLLKGLRGAADSDHDGRITTVELFNYARPTVEREARKQNVEQTPSLSPPPEVLGERGRAVWLQTK